MVGGAVLLLGLLPRSYRVALSHASLVPRISCVTQVCASRTPSVSKWDSPPVRTLHYTPPVCAGHNKWSKVKDVKIPRDAARAQMIQKLSMLIRSAVRGKCCCVHAQSLRSVKIFSLPYLFLFFSTRLFLFFYHQRTLPINKTH